MRPVPPSPPTPASDRPHSIAVPVLDRGSSADRLRNHLRRRAIVRPGLIEGDLLFLPFWRASGEGPEKEGTFHLLAAELGDPRLVRADLPPADLRPFASFERPADSIVVPASLGEGEIIARATEIGWQAHRLEELIHYPFWMMRVEDCGRVEGAWLDGVEARLIHHTLKVPRPIPALRRNALMLAVPAGAMGAVAWVAGAGAVTVAAGVAIAAVAGGAIQATLASAARRFRDG